jgi:hypothetical protein
MFSWFINWDVCGRKTSWSDLRYCTSTFLKVSRKVSGSIPDEVIEFLNWPNISSRTIALGSTQPLTETSTRNVPGGKGWPASKADNLKAICEQIIQKCGSLDVFEPWGPPWPVTRIALPFLPGKISYNVSRNSRYPELEMKPRLSEYEATVVIIEQWQWILKNFFQPLSLPFDKNI